MNTCSQCQGLISPHAQSCPHCGVSLIPHHQQPENQGEPVQEKLVCPHCGSSYTYTRKARQPLEPGAASEDLSSSVPTAIPGHPASPGLRRRSPFWQDPSALQVLSSPRYSHSKKKSIIVGLILLAVVVISVVFGAMWELRGLTPLETLLRWRM